MKIIITGATGFLGLHLAEHFAKKGHEVWGIGRNAEKGKVLANFGCHFLRASLDELLKHELTPKAFSNADIIVHSAAFSSPWGKKEEFIKSNIEGTEHILELAVKYQVKRLIHISTPSLYFKFKDETNIAESTPLQAPFPSLYTASKFEAEKLIDLAHLKNNLFTITLRPRGIFGPGDESL